MVRLAVEKLGQIRPTCFARPMLFSAQESLEAGDVIAAGVQLREAVRRYLYALCEAHDCWPRKAQTPRRMAIALTKSGHMGRGTRDWINEMIEVGNKCAHCKSVELCLITTGIELLHHVLDDAPELEQPTRGGVR